MKKLILALVFTLLPILGQTPNSSAGDGQLISPESGVNYSELEQLLTKQQWKKANSVTYDLMLEASGRAAVGWIDNDSLKKIPCSDLQIIDKLWKESSNGKFGFSAQLPIFIETGNKPGKLSNDQTYVAFGDKVGWRKDGEWIFFTASLGYSLDTPKGHLPRPAPDYVLEGARTQYTIFASRMVECKIENAPSSR